VKVNIMKGRLFLILPILLLLVTFFPVSGQVRTAFSSDPSSFTGELTTYMGPNLNAEQVVLLNSFITAWDSTYLDLQEKSNIINL